MSIKKEATKKPSQPKEASKSPSKEADKKKIRHRKRQETFSTYIFKILKQVHPQIGISKKGMNVMNSFVVDIFGRIAKEGGTLVSKNDKNTLGTREIQTSTALVLPGDLGKHALSEGSKAISKFTAKI